MNALGGGHIYVLIPTLDCSEKFVIGVELQKSKLGPRNSSNTHFTLIKNLSSQYFLEQTS